MCAISKGDSTAASLPRVATRRASLSGPRTLLIAPLLHVPTDGTSPAHCLHLLGPLHHHHHSPSAFFFFHHSPFYHGNHNGVFLPHTVSMAGGSTWPTFHFLYPSLTSKGGSALHQRTSLVTLKAQSNLLATNQHYIPHAHVQGCVDIPASRAYRLPRFWTSTWSTLAIAYYYT